MEAVITDVGSSWLPFSPQTLIWYFEWIPQDSYWEKKEEKLQFWIFYMPVCGS